jgi:PAS domain S-box-containing protein
VLDQGLDLDDYETYITRSDGTRLTILKTVNTVIFDNKRYLIESFTDITKVKEAECKAETYLKLAPALFVALDENANILMINDFGKELLECDDSVVGKNWFENFIPGYDQERIWDVFEELANGKVKNSSAENEVITAKGNKRILLWKNTVLKNIDGQKIIILSAGDDITEQRIAEMELEKYWAEEEDRLERNLEQLSLLGTNKMEA